MPTTNTTTTVDRRALAAAIDQVTPAASTDPEFPFLHTVLVEVRDGTLRLVATDRYRLAVRDLVVGGDGPAFRAVVAAAALDRVRRSLAGTDAVDVHLAEHHLVVGQQRVPRQPTEFPEYEKLLTPDDAPPSRSALVDRAALQDLVSTASGAPLLKLSFADGRVSLDADARRSVPAKYEGDPPPTVGLHPRFVAAALDAAVGPEVLVEVVAPDRPVVFRSATDSSYVCMVMPIKFR
jgi:DNA polymerase III sliding clamp (beta) subunit (PCNA family)